MTPSPHRGDAGATTQRTSSDTSDDAEDAERRGKAFKNLRSATPLCRAASSPTPAVNWWPRPDLRLPASYPGVLQPRAGSNPGVCALRRPTSHHEVLQP
nr:unnamed protein product [Digitaria exilis]